MTTINMTSSCEKIGETRNQSERLMNARCRLMTRMPFYGHIAMGMTWIPSEMSWQPEQARTMGVRITGTGEIQCLYYPPFVEKLTLKELYAVIQHEIEHIVRCHCLRIGDRNPQAWNIACCKPDEIIMGGDNKAIGELTAGSMVYGRDGKEVKVVATSRRYYKGKMITLKGRYLLPFSVTYNHKMLVVPWKLKTTNKPKTTIKEYGEPKFVEANKLIGCSSTRLKGPAKSGYSLVLPKYKTGIDAAPNDPQLRNAENGFLSLSEYIIRPCDGSIRTTKLQLDGDMAWLLGLYVAEGSQLLDNCSSGLSFSLGSHETDLANKIIDTLRPYGFNPGISIFGSSIKVSVSSPILARAFSDWFGRGAKSKKLPLWLLHNSNSCIVKSFFNGYFSGDGHNSEGIKSGYPNARNAGATTSKVLALQLQRLGFTHYVPFGLYESNRPERQIGKHILPPEKLFVLESGTWQARQFFGQSTTNRKRNHFYDAGQDIYLPLMKMTEEEYEGDVCNIETTDHTYTIANAQSRNCDMSVNGRKGSPRIGYHEPSTNEVIVPLKGDIVWIPEDWPPNETSEYYFSRLEKDHKQNCCGNCGKPLPGSGQGNNQGKSGKGKGKAQKGGTDASKGQGEGDGEGQGEGQGRVCPTCGQSENGEYNYGGIRGKSVDDHETWKQSDISADEARQLVKDLVDQAVEKSQGSVPGHLEQAIKDLSKPVVRWRELLRHYLGKHVGNHRKTYSRRNRRRREFGIAGVSHHAAAKVCVIIDTSGSVGNKELSQFFGEIDAISSRTKVSVLQWDHAFQGYGLYRRGDWKKFKVCGRGGTDMAAPMHWLYKSKLVPDCVIMLTDGECNYAEDLKFPYICVITRASSAEPNWGTTVRMKVGE